MRESGQHNKKIEIYIDDIIQSIRDESYNMRDIFTSYNTGTRRWTLESQTFSESEFASLFNGVFPNNIMHHATGAYLQQHNRLTVDRFSVPMNKCGGLIRDVYFVEVPESQYREMYSCVYFQGSPLANMITEQYRTAKLGLMTEYEILDLIEPTNDCHQRALIDTWFDIDNWFEILSVINVADISRLDNIVNGHDPELHLNPITDEFVPVQLR